jgi:hypothetical protein
VLPFRFDKGRHEYIALDTGETLPHVTGMLEAAGLVDATFCTAGGRDRGTAVHELTAAYDLDALDVARCRSPYRNYLLAHVEAMRILAPEMLHVEEPMVHERFRYGVRPDRVLRMFKERGVLEVKSGGVEKSHNVQTALQAIVVAQELELPPEHVARWCLYLKANGKFQLVQHKSRADFRAAHRVIVTPRSRVAAA